MSMTISATGIKENSKIFITPLNSTDKQPIIVSAKNIGESFEVSLDSPVSWDVKFDWWVLNVE